MSDFGDWEPADSVASHSEPDPLQVARRIHEDRAALEYLDGRTLPRWSDLTEDERTIAIHLAIGIIDALRRDPTAQTAALYLHAVRHAIGRAGSWTEVTGAERQIAVLMMRLLIGWLVAENSMPEPAPGRH